MKKNPYKFVSKSDIFVLPSLYEGFPNALIEAMACGTPLLQLTVFQVLKKLFTNEVNGILVPVKDEKALAEAIIDLLKNKNKAEKLAKEERKKEVRILKLRRLLKNMKR